MPKYFLVLASLLLVGCSSGATTRTFNTSFDKTNSTLQKLYPSTFGLTAAKPASSVLTNVITIRRDEISTPDAVLIRIEQGGKMLERSTEIVEKQITRDSTQISIQAATTSKSVIYPPRDVAYEKALMDEIEKALK